MRVVEQQMVQQLSWGGEVPEFSGQKLMIKRSIARAALQGTCKSTSWKGICWCSSPAYDLSCVHSMTVISEFSNLQQSLKLSLRNLLALTKDIFSTHLTAGDAMFSNRCPNTGALRSMSKTYIYATDLSKATSRLDHQLFHLGSLQCFQAECIYKQYV